MTWPTTQGSVGDLISAVQWNQLVFALAEVSGAAGSYTFASIPSFWTHLLLVVSSQDDTGSGSTDLKAQFNNDVAANYYNQRLRGNAAAASASENLGETSARVGREPAVSSGSFASNIIWIPNYAAVIKHSYVSCSGWGGGTTTGLIEAQLAVGFHNNALAINEIDIFPASGQFVAGCMATLYGMGAI